jgi:DNA-binding IclR family transcriptional regulator
MATTNAPKKQIQSIVRVTQIINLIADHNNSCTLAEISQTLSLNKSTVHGLVSTLKQMEFLEQNPITGAYQLGIKLFELGQSYLSHIDIRTIVHPQLVELCKKFEETCHLAILNGTEVIYLDKIDSPKSVGIISHIGGRNPSYATGVGKALLADLDNQAIFELFGNMPLKKLTSRTITNIPDLIHSLDKVRKNGFALDIGEIEIDLCCIAAPIKNHEGKTIAAISISAPKTHFSKIRIQEITQAILEKKKCISKKLGYLE